jgi:serine/threonine protein kinase
MRNFNILNINKEPEIKSDFDLVMEKNKKEIKLNIKILDFCGQGSYGVVYKCLFNNKMCAIKLSINEKSDLLYKRYNSLKKILGNHIIDIYYFGKIINNRDYKYYCIMEYGGTNLKEHIKTKTVGINNIIKQLCFIVEKIKNNKLLLTDFKLSNTLINDKNIITLTDIYMECDKYEPLCKGCAIVRTYPVLELHKSNIYEDKQYNYSYIYTLFGFSLISIFCKKSLSYYLDLLCSNFSIGDDNKNIIILLQYSCYENSNYKNNEKINNYLKNKKFKFDIKKIYKDFSNMISIRSEFKKNISNSVFRNILSNLLLPIPELRSIDNLKSIFL